MENYMPDYLQGADNVYRTPCFIVKQVLVIQKHKKENNVLISHDTYYRRTPNLTGTEEGEITMQTMDFFDTVGYYSAYYMSDKGAFNTLYVGIRDGQLYLSGLNYPAAFHSEKTNTDGTVSKVVFDGYIDDMEPYVTVTLTEKVTGISYTFNVRTVGTVNHVNLDYSEIIF